MRDHAVRTSHGVPASAAGRRFVAGPRVSSIALVFLALPWLVGWSFFDPFHKNVEEGNNTAKAGEADQALQHYGEAARVDPSSAIPDFNRGLVLTEQGEAAEAQDAFRAAGASSDPGIAADALYNLGNVHLENEEFEPAIDSYLQSLDLDPTDEDTRRNFEIALERLQEQQQQQQEDQQDQEDQDDQENQDQQQQQESQDDEEEQDEEQDPQNQDEQPQDEEEEQPEPEPQNPEDRLSREDAERLLNAVQSDELKVLEQLQQKEPPTGVVTHDW